MIKNVFYYFAVVTFLCYQSNSLHAENQKYPVDVSFLVADLKYSEQKGVKICEVQQAILCAFRADRFAYGDEGNMVPHFIKIAEQLPRPYWTNFSHIFDPGMVSCMKNQNWNPIENLEDFKNDPTFAVNCTKAPLDPFDISTYHGVVYVSPFELDDIDAFRAAYPGALMIDAATWDYWIDKYKMSALFDQNPELSQFKPRWKLYKKKYSRKLAQTVIKDLQCDRFVIKPRDEFRGNGVLIVDKKDLDETLKLILKKKSALKRDDDPSVRYWYNNNSDSFIVEEFVSSDPVYVEHLGGKLFEPTIRVAFMLIYNKNSIHVEFCGGFLRLPPLALDETGTLNQKYKDFANIPYIDKIDPEVYEKIKGELRIALPLLYEQMLNSKKK